MGSKGDETILVTGASGYIATWVVKYALDAGYRVRGTVRDPANTKKVKFLKELPGASERLDLVALDLEKSDQETFDRVVEGCVLVAHTASPLPPSTPKNENDLIIPAVNGTVNVLKAAMKASSVKRVVLTSSVAAVGYSNNNQILSEKDWTDLTSPVVQAYIKSKTLAERAAWDYVKESRPSWALSTICPVWVTGPSLSAERSSSAEIGIRFLEGKMPMVPKLSFGIVDVRDVAVAHIKALEAPIEVVNGRRFIVFNKTMWMREIAAQMKSTFGPMGYSISTMEAPNFIMRILAFFDEGVRFFVSRLGMQTQYDSSPSRDILKLQYHSVEDTLDLYGHSLIFYKHCRVTPGYKPPTDGWRPIDSA